MDRIDLEFVRTRRVPWFGLLFLLLGLGVAAAVLDEWTRLHGENAQRSEHIAKLERALRQQRTELAAARVKRDKRSEGRVKAYGRIAASLDYPWNRVFAEIEQASGKDLALLSLTHDQSTRTTRVIVEALELPAMSQFVASLNGEATAEWYIASYQLQPQSNPPTIRAEIGRK